MQFHFALTNIYSGLITIMKLTLKMKSFHLILSNPVISFLNSTYITDYCEPTILNITAVVDDRCLSDYTIDQISWVNNVIKAMRYFKCYTNLKKMILPEYAKNILGFVTEIFSR